jgi:RNA polymerase sigma factor (sigma-70 family)
MSENHTKVWEHDYALIQDCIKGDAIAWERFIAKFYPIVRYVVITTCKGKASAAEIEDSCQDLFLYLMKNDCKKLKLFNKDLAVSATNWIKVVTKRVTLNSLAVKKYYTPLDEENEEGLNPLAQLEDGRRPHDQELADREMLAKRKTMLLAALSNKGKLVYRLYYEQDLPPEEVARILDMNTNSVYQWINRIKNNLREIAQKV